jgi:hypothetical protein
MIQPFNSKIHDTQLKQIDHYQELKAGNFSREGCND